MNLYKGGYGRYEFFTVAKSKKEAIANIQKNDGMACLPVNAEVIDNIDGYKIVPSKKDVKAEVTEDGEDGDSGGTGNSELC